MGKRIALAIAWLIGIVAVIGYGFAPDYYLMHQLGNPEPRGYPLQGVSWFLGAVTLQTAAIWGIIRPDSYRLSWGRTLAALILVGAMTVFFGVSLMHAPPYQVTHFLWSAVLFVALLIAFIASVVGAVRDRENEA